MRVIISGLRLGLDLGLESVGVKDEPEEACQFTSDGDDGLGGGFATGDEPGVAPVEAILGAIGDGDDAFGLALAAVLQRKPDGGPPGLSKVYNSWDACQKGLE